MQIISNVALISINETLIIQLVSFLIFLFIINRVMFRPLQASMTDRADYISGLGQEIFDKEKEITDLLGQLQEQEAAVRAEAYVLRDALEDEGNQKASEIYTDFQNTVAELRRKTEEEVNSQIAEARKDFEKEAESLATDIMEKVLDRRLS